MHKKTQLLLNRRAFVARVASGVALGVLPVTPKAFAGEPSLKSGVKAIAFDAFPIFDPGPVFALAERMFPGKGGELSNEWRTRQFEYTWLRVAAQRYADFWQVTQEALEFAAGKLDLELGRAKRDQLMNAYLELKAWPDVLPALASLKSSGFRLVFLSNFTRRMLDANIAGAGLAGLFESVLSTDQESTYKPDPCAYQLGTDALGLEPREVLFVPSAGWDAAGAKLFGYRVFWVNRQRLPAEKFGPAPDCTGNSVAQLVRYLG